MIFATALILGYVLMYFNIASFALLLVASTAITGFIYLLDVLFWEKKRAANQDPPEIILFARSVFSILLIVLLLRSFLFEPFRIPTGSLEPTLEVGDFLAVNKFAYGFRLPVIEKKIIPVANPKTADIAVFRWPPNPSYDFIKRVIGVPGDHVEYHNKVLKINGKEMNQKFIEYTTDESSGNPVAKYVENLNGVKHFIYIRPEAESVDLDVTVPKGQYFMMGDNRDDSADSRYFGFVPDDHLRGKASLVWLSWNNKTYSVRWNKLGTVIH